VHGEILTDRQQEGLAVLSRTDLLSRFYLVGGTAAALHMGHRLSVDFDLFSDREFDASEVLDALEGTLTLEVRRRSESTLHLQFNGVPVTFLHYPYPLIEPLVLGPAGLMVVQLKDLLAMKLVAVSQRGSRKDFVDLYFLVTECGLALDDGPELLRAKYPGVAFEWYHLMSSLQYFGDAERQPMPAMLRPFDWEQCKQHFQSVVPPLARKLLGER
jgi:hypothetical protein